jgi:hypothetical protein
LLQRQKTIAIAISEALVGFLCYMGSNVLSVHHKQLLGDIKDGISVWHVPLPVLVFFDSRKGKTIAEEGILVGIAYQPFFTLSFAPFGRHGESSSQDTFPCKVPPCRDAGLPHTF